MVGDVVNLMSAVWYFLLLNAMFEIKRLTLKLSYFGHVRITIKTSRHVFLPRLPPVKGKLGTAVLLHLPQSSHIRQSIANNSSRTTNTCGFIFFKIIL